MLIQKLVGLLLFFSGVGPFSHVRASDKNGDVVENNKQGVMEYTSKKYIGNGKNAGRLTYVSNRYIGGQNYGVTTRSLVGKAYTEVGMCVGAAGLVNSKYKAGAPNNFLPWIYRNYWSY